MCSNANKELVIRRIIEAEDLRKTETLIGRCVRGKVGCKVLSELEKNFFLRHRANDYMGSLK